MEDGKTDGHVEGLIRMVETLGTHLGDATPVGQSGRSKHFTCFVHRFCGDVEGADHCSILGQVPRDPPIAAAILEHLLARQVPCHFQHSQIDGVGRMYRIVTRETLATPVLPVVEFRFSLVARSQILLCPIVLHSYLRLDI